MEKFNFSHARVFVVDDEDITCKLLRNILKDLFLINATTCNDPRLAMDEISNNNFDLVLLDLHMPWLSGIEMLEKISQLKPELPIVILTSDESVENAVHCMRLGAFDFITKPVQKARIATCVHNALSLSDLKKEVEVRAFGPRVEPKNPEAFANFQTQNPTMKSIFSYIEVVASSPKTVLITGESGTGKELVARAIHQLSGRTGAFIPINVSGLDETMFSDSLFGHTKGAFTGADQIRKGLIEQAHNGTLFLDEIGDLDPNAQIKLLRLLQEGEYYPIGSDKAQKSYSRIIAATNANLVGQDTKFRKDLYYRLISHQIHLPSLRERKEDIIPLAEHFLKETCETLKKGQVSFDSSAIDTLKNHNFPGNIRELQAILFDAVSRTEGNIVYDYVFSGIEKAVKKSFEPIKEVSNPQTLETYLKGPGDVLLGEKVPKIEELLDFLYKVAIDRSKGRQQEAAALLGVSQPTLSRWINKQKSQN